MNTKIQRFRRIPCNTLIVKCIFFKDLFTSQINQPKIVIINYLQFNFTTYRIADKIYNIWYIL